jgi:hypothetical protein
VAPADLLAAAGSPSWVEDPAWSGRRWLTPTIYHGHTLHLYAEAGLPYVLWQVSSGEWRLLTSPADLLQLAQQRPVVPAMRALLRRHGVGLEPILVGLPLFTADTASSGPTHSG